MLFRSGLEKVHFSIGDIIIKGDIEDSISKQSDLKVNSYNITTAINNIDYDDNMKHWYIEAK